MEDKELELRRANNAVISRDFALAARIYNNLLSEEPENVELLTGAANVYVKAGSDQRAVPFYEKILSINENDFNALDGLGGIYRRINQPEKSIEYLQKAVSTGKNNAEAYYNLGFTYKAMGKTDEAIQCFEDVIALNPHDVLAYNHLGAIYADKGDHQKAISTYKTGLQIDHNHPVLQFNLAKSCEAVHDDGGAVQAYESCLKARPGWQEAVTSYAKMLLNHRKTKAAGEAVKNSIALHPQDPDLHNLFGKICILQGNYDGAIKSCEKADSLKPGSGEYLCTLAQSYEKSGRPEQALATIQQACEADGNSSEIKKNLVHIELSAGRVENAGMDLEKISSSWQEEPELLNLAGQLRILENKTQEAEELQKKSLSIDPSYTESYNEYAMRFKQMNNLDKAKEQIKLAIDENMKDVFAWVLLGQIDEEMGNLAEAEEDYSTAMAFDPHNVLASYLYRAVCSRKAAEAPVQESQSGDSGNSFDSEEISLDEFGLDSFGSDSEDNEESEDVTALFNDETFADEIFDENNAVNEEESAASDSGDMEINLPEDDMEALFNDETLEDIQDEVIPTGDPTEIDDVSQISQEEIDPMADFFEEQTDIEPVMVMSGDPAVNEEDDSDPLDFGNPNFAFNDLYQDSDIPAENKGISNEDVEILSESMNASVQSASESAETAQNSSIAAETSAQKASEAAEKAWMAAQQAADAAQISEETQKNIKEAAENAVAEAADKVVLSKFEEMLPAFTKAVETEDGMHRFEKEVALFEKLLEIGKSLPEPKLTEFMESKTRVMLDYLISRLSGKQGLLKSIEAYLNSGLIEANPDVQDVEITDIRQSTISVLDKICDLTKDLEDKHLAKGLDACRNDLLSRL